MAERAIHRVIIDTDPGIDDAMALLFLRRRADVALLALTTVFGNADIATTTRNALYLVERFGLDTPVYRGAADPLVAKRRPGAAHVHGHDAFGDTNLAAGFAGEPAAGPAHEAIIRLVRAQPGEVSILAIGPLTNLALAIRQDPGIAPLVREIVIMGGAFGHGSRGGNVSPVAEANIAGDPHAADVVLTAPWPVTMVGLDVTSACIFPAARAWDMAGSGAAGQFLWDISRGYEALYREHDGLDGACLHDVAAALRLVEPDLFETARGPIRVVPDGIAAGQTIQKPEALSFPPGAWDGMPSQQVCVGVDAQRLLAVYEQAIVEGDRLPALLGG
jgi:inosine-uridine nucleoside N-ribohydrolase